MRIKFKKQPSLEKIIQEELQRILNESYNNLEGFEDFPDSEAIEIIRSMDPDKITDSTIRIFMTHPSSTVTDYVKQKFEKTKDEDPPELLGIKIFLAYPNEGRDEPLRGLAQELRLDIDELPTEEEIENLQNELNNQEEEEYEDFPTTFTSSFGGGSGLDPLEIETESQDDYVYLLSPSLGSYIDTLVGTYKRLLRPYQKYSHENYKKQRIEAVRKEIKSILKITGK